MTDLGSTNGTNLDGNDLKPQEPAVVAVGSQISFGALRPRRRNTCRTLPATAASRGRTARIVFYVIVIEKKLCRVIDRCLDWQNASLTCPCLYLLQLSLCL